MIARFRDWTAAQIAALVFGIWWIFNALAVFVAEPGGASLNTDATVHSGGLSIAVNGWHGIFHLGTGLLGVAVCRRRRASLNYALAMAIVYLGAALWSVFDQTTVFGVIHVDDLGSADHAVEGVLMLAAWIVSGRTGAEPAPQICANESPHRKGAATLYPHSNRLLKPEATGRGHFQSSGAFY